ncbi:Protein SEY1-like [Gracilariopsis chorda]|uniref:Protein SEY1-like n=1 Tax=Gracilariopsis chorda TaxID=448386 RepID=A0A2V3J3P5_9FLOR|nr:Protein SEY1-like [Gracilariopsis chorda]|eukprot:PXF49015.1 Protein SEY1-like [Gracilariopsis chorda]
MVVPSINGLQAASTIAGDAFAVVFAAAPRNASAVRVLSTALDVNISVPAPDLAKSPRKAHSQDTHMLCAGAAPGGPLLITFDGLHESGSASSLENSLTLATAVSGVILLSVRLHDLVRPSSSGIPEIMTAIERSLVLRVSGVAPPLPKRRLFVVAVRDYESDQVEQDELEHALSDRLSAAYSEIDLPSGYAATEFSDLFDLHVFTFPVERHCAADFEVAVNKLGGFLRDANNKYADAGMTGHRLSDIIAKVQDSIRAESAEDLPEDKELTATFSCSTIMQNVFDKYRNATKRWKATVDTGRIVANFGAENDRLIERTLEVYDKDASAFKSTAAYLRKREELKSRLLADSYALFAKQILKVRENAYQVFRAKLARIRITDKVEKNVRGAVKVAESFFVEHGEVLRSKLGSWRFDNERHELVNHMRDDATERLQLARLQGNYVPSIRAPIAFAFHTLLLAPFGKDSRMQVPYAEEMKQTYDPDKVKQAYIMRIRPFQGGQVRSVNSSDEFVGSSLDQLGPLFEDGSADDS